MTVGAMIEKPCLGCNEDFHPQRSNQTCCKRLLSWVCEICTESFDRICRIPRPRACSKSCTSKLIRRDQGLRNMIPCELCSDPFPAVMQDSKYCNKNIIVTCKGCPKTFERPCNGSPGSYCTTSCRFKYMRANNYSISFERNCQICKKSFTPSSSKQISCGLHETDCKLCGEIFTVGSQKAKNENLGKYCGNVCSTLAQFNSTLSKELISEYKDPNEWAVSFKLNRGRKPSVSDFQAYFNIDSFPTAKVDLSLFKKIRDSRFEKSVVNAILEFSPELEITRRFRRIYLPESNFPKEIDIYIEELKLGFEVQDFATHSRTSETEMSSFQKPKVSATFKRGPLNHEAKRLAAKTQLGITLIDIWEDEIKDGRYKNIVANAIAAAQESILVK